MNGRGRSGVRPCEVLMSSPDQSRQIPRHSPGRTKGSVSSSTGPVTALARSVLAS